ncbi:hypothetical protein [Burkholderia sp. MSMB1835]|uniref:hypothetical protein n=1 Tax=Burkholderia sp. MSMB1835 TaxID=1637876 RepID=UPI0012E38315|nr:hypothetical protein [Burkholderia sp. MSMB1835]
MHYAGWATGIAILGASPSAASSASNVVIVSSRVMKRFAPDDIASAAFTSELLFILAVLY